MIVVLDINALLVSIPKKSKYRPIFDALLDGKFSLIISNDILSEYTEIIELKTNHIIANNVAEMLLNLSNVHRVEVYFEWKFIHNDPDDNKYVDAAIIGAADYIVTNDQHFNILNTIDFPKVKVLNIESFLENIKTTPPFPAT